MIESGGSLSVTNKETDSIAETPQPIIIDTLKDNEENEVVLLQDVIDKDDNPVTLRFEIPPWTPKGCSIDEANGNRPWIKSLGDSVVTGAEDGYVIEILGLEGSIAKLMGAVAVEQDKIKVNRELIRASIDLFKDVSILVNRQLYQVANRFEGLNLNEEGKRALVKALNFKIQPTQENILNVIKLFTGSTDPDTIYIRDDDPMEWSVRLPKPLALDAIWAFEDFPNYEWLMNRIKPIATNVIGVEWFFSIIEDETWSPESWVYIFDALRYLLGRYDWHSQWDSHIDGDREGYTPMWDGGGAWETPLDVVWSYTPATADPNEIRMKLL